MVSCRIGNRDGFMAFPCLAIRQAERNGVVLDYIFSSKEVKNGCKNT